MGHPRRPRHVSPPLIDTGRSIVSAKRTRRGVRLTVIMNPDLTFSGTPNTASFAYADLSNEMIDRLVRRLMAIRGGKMALP